MVTKQKPSPLSLNHVVLFAGDLREQQTFYEKVIGMRVTDTVPNFMTFLRCNPNHHSCGFIALPGRGLQHAAFDLAGRVELSEAIFHLGDGGFRRVDGPGRHGPGNMLFTYFEDPEKNLLELCTEIQQIDETSHQPRAWDAKGALNLWNSFERMGPPERISMAPAFARDDLEVVEICFSIGEAVARRGSGNRPQWN